MLIRLFGENFRSLRDPFELSFVAANLPSEGDRGVVGVQPDGTEGEDPLRVLRCVAVYGANASGKSTVLRAGKAIEWLIGLASRRLEPESSIEPYEPFALSPKTRGQPISLGCTIFHEGHFYEYEIKYTKTTVEFEKLTRLDDPELPLLIREDANKVEGKWINSSDQLQALVAAPKPNTPAFSFLAQHGPDEGEPTVRSLWLAFLSRLDHQDYSTPQQPVLLDATAKRMKEEPAFSQWVMDHLMRPADLGITGVEVHEFDLPPGFPEDLVRHLEGEGPFYQAEFVHHGSHGQIELDEESAGTRKMYGLAANWWALANEPRTILGDELSASLHPTLLDHLIRAVNESERDHEGQLAFTTHDTGLLEGRAGTKAALRKDQVYFTKKDEDGATTLYSLTEYKDEARTGTHNIRKRYLSGRYDAIPNVEGLSL